MLVNVKIRRSYAWILTICLISTAAAWAHHATALQYDISRTVELKGVVSKLDWANPHAHVYIDFTKDSGVAEHWNVELGSPGAIIVAGLSRELLSPGTTLTITGYPGKTNSTNSKMLSICATHVTLADGSVATFVVGI